MGERKMEEIKNGVRDDRNNWSRERNVERGRESGI